MSRTDSRAMRISWVLLTVVTTMVALSALWVAFTPAGDQTHLSGRTWDEFAAQDPEVAGAFSRQLGVLGFLGAGFGSLAAVIAFIPYRRGERWAWLALWLFAVAIGAVAVRMLVDQYPPGTYYAGITAVALAGLVLPIRDFIRRSA